MYESLRRPNERIPIRGYLEDVFNEAHLTVLFEDMTADPDNCCVKPTSNVNGGWCTKAYFLKFGIEVSIWGKCNSINWGFVMNVVTQAS